MHFELSSSSLYSIFTVFNGKGFQMPQNIMQVLQGNVIISNISIAETMKYHIRKGFICKPQCSCEPVSSFSLPDAFSTQPSKEKAKVPININQQYMTVQALPTIPPQPSYPTNPISASIYIRQSRTTWTIQDFFKPLFYLSMLFFYAMRFSRVIKYKYTGESLTCWGKTAPSRP